MTVCQTNNQDPTICALDPLRPIVRAGEGTVPDQKPNFLVIQFDDLGFADFQHQGFAVPRTPNITALARRGMTAERYFTASTVCSPSRYSMATGRHSAEDGVFTTISSVDSTNFQYNNIEGIPINVPTIYSELKAEGYRTAHHGKWHMGLDPTLMNQLGYGLDEYSGWAFHDPGTPDPSDRQLQQTNRLGWEEQRDQIMTDRTCEFIRSSGQSPFFVNLSFHAPHYPLYPSEEGLAAVSHLAENNLFQTLDPDDTRNPNAAQRYYAAIWDADRRIGELMTCLQQQGLTDNTVVIVTADNGPLTNRSSTPSADQWGSVGSFRGYKNTAYNGGVRVPFVVAGPTIPEGLVLEEATLSATDVMPTLLTMANRGVPPGVDGQNMLSRWQGQDIDRTKPLHWLTIQNLPISIHVADRSPTIRGYYPAGTVGNNQPFNVYCNEPGTAWERDPEIYFNEDNREMDNLWKYALYSNACGSLRDNLVQANKDWYRSLENPRLRSSAGRLEHRT